MEQYIKKSALVSEIEKLIDEIYAGRPFDSLSSEQQTALWYVKSIMSSINNLEVKEVDFEKIWKEYFKYRGDVATVNVKHLAKHFYELGLKAQKGK